MVGLRKTASLREPVSFELFLIGKRRLGQVEVSLRRAEADRERIRMGVRSMPPPTFSLQGWGLLAKTLSLPFADQ